MSIHGFDESMLWTQEAQHLYIECMLVDNDPEKYGHEEEKFILHKKIIKFLNEHPQKGIPLPWALIKVTGELHLVDTRCNYNTFIYKGLSVIEDDYIFLGFEGDLPIFKKEVRI